MLDLQSGGCRFESRPGLLRTKVYSAFHPSGVGKWVPVIAGKAKAGMSHSDCGWTCGCAGKTVKSLENTRHTWALLRWWFTMKRCYIKCMDPYLRIVEVVVTTGAIRTCNAKLQSNRRRQQTNTQLFTGWIPFLLPNQQCQSTEGKKHLCISWEIFTVGKQPCTTLILMSLL